ncbi:MAG TPA: DUF4350 domain-containing protein [Gemmatimonadaceae bacterium]|nr:DUF4350 domain-containing protein [Gemmatimonadaceae bacterium]
MTAPDAAAPAPQAWYLRPKVVLPVVGLLILIMAVNVRERNIGRTGDPRLSAFSTAPMGARMFYEMAQRFGWDADRRKTPDVVPDTTTITAELDPPVPLRPADVHALLDGVRAGGALLVMLGDGSALLADSLHLRPGDGRLRVKHQAAESEGCADDKPSFVSSRFITTIWPGDQVTLRIIQSHGPLPASATMFVALDTVAGTDHGRPRHAAIGFPFGRGRIVAGADPDLLRNDAVRNCLYGLDVAAMDMLAYLGQDGRRTHLVFDEYHQGYGDQRGTMGAIAAYLAGTPSGRTLAQLLAAGLVLLLAAAPRLIPPRDPGRIERRSPLEHVDALGRAYAQVNATRSATARLVRGVRRRVGGGALRADTDVSDDAFLDRAARDAPRLAPDVALIRRALREGVTRREFAAVGVALEQLELSLTRI